MRIAVFPGSFDPVTTGHQDIIARASKLFDRVYVSIVPNGTKTHPMFTDEQKLALMRASVEELSGLPPAFLVVDENDVLRDEGEAYARKLTEAGVRTVSVRYNGTVHDFMMLNPLRATAATSAAIAQAVAVIRHALGID